MLADKLFSVNVSTYSFSEIFAYDSPLQEETTSPQEDLPHLWPPFHLAKEMGKMLGRGKILLRTMPEKEQTTESETTVRMRGLYTFPSKGPARLE
jgi:hypothetical protein